MPDNIEQDKEINLEIVQESTLHHYRTEIPNIIFEMNLDPIDFKAYCVLKKIAGDAGSCFKSIVNLCEEIGISRTRYKQAKRNLEFFGLIKITTRKNSLGEPITDLITIVDIWTLNMKLMVEKLSKKDAGGVGHQTTEGRSPNDRPQSPRDPKQELIKKISFNKKQQQKPSAVKKSAAPVVVFPSLNQLEISQKDKEALSSKYPEEQIDLAVKRVQTWRTRKCKDLQAIRSVLKNADDWEDSIPHSEIIAKNLEYLEKLRINEGSKLGKYRCTVRPGSIEFDPGRSDAIIEFKVGDKKFIDRVWNFIQDQMKL